MKRMIIALVIMAALTIAVVINSYFITGVINNINESLSQLPDNEEDFGDGSSSLLIVNDIEQRWEKLHLFIHLTLQVSESREVCLLIADLRVFAEAGDFVGFRSTIDRLKVLLHHIYESEELSLKSIL